jgi:hypothetical protein
MEYAVTAAFLLSVVAGSFAAVILGGYFHHPTDRLGSLIWAARPAPGSWRRPPWSSHRGYTALAPNRFKTSRELR